MTLQSKGKMRSKEDILRAIHNLQSTPWRDHEIDKAKVNALLWVLGDVD